MTSSDHFLLIPPVSRKSSVHAILALLARRNWKRAEGVLNPFP
jgi:hypothetical protein